jgi:hypothetical protein
MTHGRGELRQRIDRCRRARDKYTDLYREQSRASAARAGARGEALSENERTAEKADLSPRP